jgi:hypothetical protein
MGSMDTSTPEGRNLRRGARAAAAGSYLFLALGLFSPARALPDGDLDPTFGNGDGLVTWEGFGPVILADLTATDDRLYAVGRYSFAGGGPHLHWWSVDPSGERDLDHFCEGESDEIFPVSLATSSRAEVGIVDSLGRLVVAGALAMVGTESQDRPLVARFDLGEDGCVLDETFTSNGWHLFDDESWCSAADCEVLGLVELTPATGAVLASRLVALVRASSGGLGASRLFLLRLTPAGNPDTAFGGDGWIEIGHPDFGTLFDEAALAMDARGRIYVLITHADIDGPLDLDVSVLRYQPNGVVDGTFGSNGRIAVSDQSANDAIDGHAKRLEVSPDGTILASYTETGAATPSRLLVRRDSDGAAEIQASTSATPFAAAMQGNGRVVSGQDRDDLAQDNFRVQRRIYDASSWSASDSTFGNGAFAIYDVDLGGGDAETLEAVLLWHGRIVYGGSASAVGSTASFLVRAKNGYIFADGFESGNVVPWSAASGFAFPELD